VTFPVTKAILKVFFFPLRRGKALKIILDIIKPVRRDYLFFFSALSALLTCKFFNLIGKSWNP